MEKTCSNCKKTKNVSEFHRKGNRWKSRCKKCRQLLENEESKIRMKEYKKNNIEHVRKQQKDWSKKESSKQKRNEYQKKKRNEDPQYRIRHNLRCRLNKALKGILKIESTLSLLGCSNKQFKKHIESLFVDGMNWGNYGKWHIDHIIPCSSFDLTLEESQRKCFHYTNLQPLWAKDNILKSDSL